MGTRATGRRGERWTRGAEAMSEPPLQVLVASDDADLCERVRRHLQGPGIDVEVATSPWQLLFVMEAREEAGGREGPDLVVLDDRACPLGSLLLLVDRIVAHSALMLCVGEDGPLHPACGAPLGAVAVLHRPLSLSALRSAVMAFRSLGPSGRLATAGEGLERLIQLDSEELDEEPRTERTPMFVLTDG